MLAKLLRAALAALAFACAEAASAAPCAGFTDVEDTSPFCGNVTFLRNRGITLGCTATLYCPNDPVTRLAMAAFLNRLADALFPLNCAAGQVMKWNGAAWACADDVVGGTGGGGTVTSVLAGTGLAGSPNPITSAGSINIAPTFQLPQGCTANQIPKWNGTAWTCAADVAGGAGTVTQVDTGAGLTGGPITSTGTVAIAAGGVGATQLASNAVTTAKIADANVTAAKIAPGAIGSTALAAGIASARPPYAERLLDANGTGQFHSIVLGADGLPLIAYYAQSSGDLKVAHCESVDCATTTITTIDSTGNVGQYVAAIVQANGLPAIAYYDVTNTALKIAFCADVRCASATLATIDSNNDVGKYVSIALNESGQLRVAYFDETLDDLKFATCSNTPCFFNSTWTVSTPVSAGSVGRGTAMTVALFGNQTLIAYFDATLEAVRIARCTTLLCDAPVLNTARALGAGRIAEGLAITLNQAGLPVISFIDRLAGGIGFLRILVCDSIDCAAPTTRAGGNTNFELTSTGVTVPFDNLPIAMGGDSLSAGDCESASSGSAGATLLKCLDAACTSQPATNNLSALVGGASMTLNSTGFPMMSFRRCGSTGSRLGFIHCATATCIGHIRPR